MALRVVTGSANSGKTGTAYGRVRHVIDACGCALILVPSAPDAMRVAEEFALETPIGLATQTLDTFLDRCWHVRGDGRRIITGAERLLLLEETVRLCQAGGAAEYLRARGTVAVLSRLVQRAAESPEVRCGGAVPDSAAGALLGALSAYGDLLRSTGLVERAEAHRSVLDRLEREDVPDVIIVNGVTGLTAAQERFVLRAAMVTEVLICLTYDPGIPATAGAAGLVARLAAAGSLDHRPPSATYTRSVEISAIERSLGGPAPATVVPEGAVIVSEAWGEAAEAARIVREIQDAISDSMPAGRIAVVFRDPAAYVGPLGAALEEAGLTAEWAVQVPFARSGLGRALLAALRLAGGEHSVRMDLLRTPYSPTTDVVLDALDARVRAVPTVSARRLEDLVGEVDPLAGAFLRDVRMACSAVGRAEGRRRWHRLVSRMLQNAWRADSSADPQVLLDVGAARVFAQVVDGATSLGDSRVRIADIAPVLAEATITLTSREDPGRVQIMAAERARGRRFECVVVGGLNAGVFPRAARDDVLSATAVATALSSAGIDTAPRSGLEQERLLFYQVVTRATRRLVLSTQTHDADGRQLRPSVFLEELLDLYRYGAPEAGAWPGPPRHVLEADGLARDPFAPLTSRRVLREAATLGCAPDWCGERDAARIASALRRSRRESPTLGRAARDAIAARDTFSATEIETYLGCPYRWYVERVLQPQGLEVRVDAAAAGVLAHAIMRRFYEEFIGQTGQPRLTPGLLAEARGVHASVAEEAARAVRAVSVSEEVQVRATVRQTWRLLEADATLLPGMTPVYREWAFGMPDEPESFGDFLLRGRVDRIDADDTRLVVTDYKLGGISHTRAHTHFASEGLVQLPLYAAVAARRLGRAAAGGVYRSMKGGKPRGFIDTSIGDGAFVRTDRVDAAAAQAVISGAIERTREAVGGMRAGRIDAEPPSAGCPGYCAARTFCAEWRPGDGRA